MNSAGGTDEKLRFAREVVRELSPMLRPESDYSSCDLRTHEGRTKLQVDEILFEVAPDEPEVVVLFRDVENPGHLYQFRSEASLDNEMRDANIEAMIFRANFIEAVEGGLGMRGGSATRITKIDW